MTVIETAPRRARPDEDDGADVVHLWCCDENVAMCGVDISGDPVEEDPPDEKTCEMCLIVEDNDWACPAPGCKG